MAYTDKKAIVAGGYVGYKVLLEQVLKFFKTGVAPVSKEETLEIFAFMRASNLSKERGGKMVTLDEVFKQGEKEAKRLLKQYAK